MVGGGFVRSGSQKRVKICRQFHCLFGQRVGQCFGNRLWLGVSHEFQLGVEQNIGNAFLRLSGRGRTASHSSQQAVKVCIQIGLGFRGRRGRLHRGLFGLGSVKLALQIISGGSQQAVDIHAEVGRHIRACRRGWRRLGCRSRLRRGGRFWLGCVKLAL